MKPQFDKVLYLDKLSKRVGAFSDFVEATRQHSPDYRTQKDFTARLYGLSSEVGEVLDIYKKNMELGQEIKRERLVEEFGDVLYYLIACTNVEGIQYKELLSQVILKLLRKGFIETEADYQIYEKLAGEL